MALRLHDGQRKCSPGRYRKRWNWRSKINKMSDEETDEIAERSKINKMSGVPNWFFSSTALPLLVAASGHSSTFEAHIVHFIFYISGGVEMTRPYMVLYAVLSVAVFSKVQPGSVMLLALTNDGIIILTNAGLSACVKLNYCLHVSNSIIPTITLA